MAIFTTKESRKIRDDAKRFELDAYEVEVTDLMVGEDDYNLKNLPDFTRRLLAKLNENNGKTREVVGLPAATGMYEMLPFWHSYFRGMGYRVEIAGIDENFDYTPKGETELCYAAALMDRQLDELCEKGAEIVIFPDLEYAMLHGDETEYRLNCPAARMLGNKYKNDPRMEGKHMMDIELDLNDEYNGPDPIYYFLTDIFGASDLAFIRRFVRDSQFYLMRWNDYLKRAAAISLDDARENGAKILILAGRPYYNLPAIGHKLDIVAEEMGYYIVGAENVSMFTDYTPEEEDPECPQAEWAFEDRMRRAAKYALEHPECKFVHMVLGGCGLDEKIAQELKEILGDAYNCVKVGPDYSQAEFEGILES